MKRIATALTIAAAIVLGSVGTASATPVDEAETDRGGSCPRGEILQVTTCVIDPRMELAAALQMWAFHLADAAAGK